MKSLYVHIPFCTRKCFYCSFVVSVGHDHWIDPYLKCLEKELQIYKGASIKTIYLGGGTPTYLNFEQLKFLFKIIKDNFDLRNLREWTIEANPEGIDAQKAKLIFDEGITRISLGVQTLNDAYLKYLGRCHDAKKAIETFTLLRKTGFQNINLDLMYSFPEQTDEEIISDVKEITRLKSEHLSLYTLTIEENSKFYTSQIALSDSDIRARQYELVVAQINQSGFKQYEVSNFSRADQESLHNINYWKGGEYIGVGVGAHSYLNRERFWNVEKTAQYISKLENKESAVLGRETLSLEKTFMEIFLLGLRMNEGCNVKELSIQLNFTLPRERIIKIDHFIEQDLLIWDKNFLKVTSKGRLLLDEISTRLI